MRTVSALVVDDEPLARRRLRELLADTDWLQWAGECTTGIEALARITEISPDLVFLDIHMPGLSGIEVMERMEAGPRVIFTTAYDRYAVTAFELQALDYLLKPFGEERFRAVVERAREALRAPKPTPDALERTRVALGGAAPVERLFLSERGRIIPVEVSAIQRLQAEGDYVMVFADGRRYLVHVRMKDFERRLDPRRFIRVHRTHIVNLSFVKELTPFDGSRLMVHLSDGTSILASRGHSKRLRRMVM